MKIFESRYRIIELIPEYSLIINQWNEKTIELTDELFKKDMLDYLGEVIKKYRPERIFHDIEEFNFAISPVLQTWIDREINQPCINFGTKKGAFVVPKDIFSMISVEQTMDEGASKQVEIKYFQNKDAALEWIKK